MSKFLPAQLFCLPSVLVRLARFASSRVYGGAGRVL
jgi:hypothetical protein